MFKLTTPVTLANSYLDVWILLALYYGGGCRRSVYHKGVNHLTDRRSLARHGTLLSTHTAGRPLCYTL